MNKTAKGNVFKSIFGEIGNGIINFFDFFLGALQKVIGIKGIPYLFVLPNLLIFGIFILTPVLLNFVYAFTGSARFLPTDRPFVGTRNFERIFSCENYLVPNSCQEDLFWRAAQNTVVFVIFQVSLLLLVSLLTALVLNRKIRFRGFFRAVYFYPVLLSPIVVGLIWQWILMENGLLNGILVGIGLDKMRFLTNANWARFWVIMVSVWNGMGFYTLILLAGLQSIPADLYEAASIDGADGWKAFHGITLPLLMPTMTVVLVLSMIRAVQVFEIIYSFTGGGPGTATMYVVQYIYNYGFSSPNRQFGLAAAASLLMAGVLVVLTLLQLAARREEVYE
ncbi:MAG: sugar ABC transporter permease [Anaerolineaceae bacterium]|nr:sugar ABC transporter permease [Anaerolineaceae bacterium]